MAENSASFSNKDTLKFMLHGVVVITLGVCGWLMVDKVTSFSKQFDKVDAQREQMWKIVGDMAKDQAEAAKSLIRIETSLNDYVKTQDHIITQLATSQSQQDQRIRTLELGAPKR